MQDVKYDAILLIDEEYEPVLTKEEKREIIRMQKKFLQSFLKKSEEQSVEEWLNEQMTEELPGYTQEEICEMCNELIDALTIQDEKQKEIRKAISNGRSKEAWFASEIKKATSSMSTKHSMQYLKNLDDALVEANNSMRNAIQTKSGLVNMNPNLDGFIAEQYHALTFNLNAEARGSSYRAKVLEPEGTRYAKNSVDIVIKDAMGENVHKYQSKYCKDAESTAKAFEHGDYRGQQKLVPEGQEGEMTKKVTTFLEAKDGTRSNPLTKDQAKEFQKEAQSGNWNELNWNEYHISDLSKGIAKKAGQSALIGAAVGAGVNIVQQLSEEDTVDLKEALDAAIESGTDFGTKAAIAGAVKVCSERGVIKIIPKGTPIDTIANIIHVAVENVKVIKKMSCGEVTFKEGVEEMQQVTGAAVMGLSAQAKGALIGAKIGKVFGVPGAAVGGFIGSVVGYALGSKVGEETIKFGQRVQESINEEISYLKIDALVAKDIIVNGVKDTVENFKETFA